MTKLSIPASFRITRIASRRRADAFISRSPRSHFTQVCRWTPMASAICCWLRPSRSRAFSGLITDVSEPAPSHGTIGCGVDVNYAGLFLRSHVGKALSWIKHSGVLVNFLRIFQGVIESFEFIHFYPPVDWWFIHPVKINIYPLGMFVKEKV